MDAAKAATRAPQPGDYGCVSIPWINFRGHRVPNVVGYLIRLFTWSRYDHAIVYVGNGMIVEARPSGARLSNLSEYDGDVILWSTDDLTPAERATIVATALSFIGVGYNFLDIIYLGLARLGIRWRWLLDRVEDLRRDICSQIVALCGQAAGRLSWLCGQPNACLVTPALLAKRIKAPGRKITSLRSRT